MQFIIFMIVKRNDIISILFNFFFKDFKIFFELKKTSFN